MLRGCPTALATTVVLSWLAISGCAPPRAGIFGFCSETATDAPPDAGVSSASLTYAADIKPIIDLRCTRCHQQGGMAPFPLTTYESAYGFREASNKAVQTGHMPPWQPAPCCAPLEQDWSMPQEERAKFAAWVSAGAPSGDLTGVTPTPQPPSPLSRVDVTIKMPAPYRPQPPPGSTDDGRCFVLDWPVQRDVFVTGLNVVPGNRQLVHHLILAVVKGKDGESLRRKEGKDGSPGYDCPGGAFGATVTRFLGGGVGGLENPRGLGVKVEAGSKIIMQVHYSTLVSTASDATDQTTVELRVEDQAFEAKSMVIANPFWLAGDAMKVKAGDANAVYFYRYRPTVFTAGKRVQIEGMGPHMHAFGKRFLLGIIRANGTRDCLLEIPDWHFGWEQSYWLKTPKVLEPDDQVYVECQFDNSAENQPIINGERAPPRDFAWGGDNQDMCAGFLSFTDLP